MKPFFSTLLLLPLLAVASVRPQDADESSLDRTFEVMPLKVWRGTKTVVGVLSDNSFVRPAVVVDNATFEAKSVFRKPTGIHARPTDPGLGKWFDGTFLPFCATDFSYHDFTRANIVAIGDFHIKVDSLTGDLGILVLPNPDGTYGKDSTIDIGYGKGRSVVFAAGQERLRVNIVGANQMLYSYQDAEVGGGHVFYGNEARAGGKFLRLLYPSVTIGRVVSSTTEKNLRVLASPTAKFKGSHGVYYRCLNDRNMAGALDSFQSWGFVDVLWSYPAGGTAQNTVFTGMRLGDGAPQFGDPPGEMVVRGSFDGTHCPDKSVPVAAIHVNNGKVRSMGVRVVGKYDVYGKAITAFPIRGEAVAIKE